MLVRLLMVLILMVSLSTSTIKSFQIAMTDEEISDHYLKFLNLKNNLNDKTMNRSNQFKQKLTAASFYRQIVEFFKQHRTPNGKNEILNAKFKQFDGLISEFSQFSLFNNCKLWVFWRELVQLLKPDSSTNNDLENKVKNCENIVNCFGQGWYTVKSDEYCNLYLQHFQQSHFEMLSHLLPNESERDFLQFFENEKRENETKFAYTMRKSRKFKINAIIQNKNRIEHELVGPELMRQLEFLHPFYMAIDKIGFAKEAATYAFLFSPDQSLRHRSELMLSIRIYAARIIDIFTKTHQIIKWNDNSGGEEFEDLKAHIHFAWRRGIVSTNANECWQNANFDEALAPVRWRWLRLIILYKQIKDLSENHPIWVDSVDDNVRNAGDQLVEDYANKMISLCETENVFSNYLKNAFTRENGAEGIRSFFKSKFNENPIFYEGFVEKFPEIGPVKLRQTFENAKIQMNLTPHFFQAFLDDSFLYGKYAEFLSSPWADYQIVLLDIGAYVNEIEKRIQMWEQLQKMERKIFPKFDTFDQSNSLILIKIEWTNSLTLQPIYVEELHNFRKNLHKILCKILQFTENVKFGSEEAFDYSYRLIRTKIHERKILSAFFANDKCQIGNEWKKIVYNLREMFCQKLFLKNYLKFSTLPKKMDTQIALDIEIFNKTIPETEQNNFLHPTFPKISQQLYFSEQKNYLTEIEHETMAEYNIKIKNSLKIIYTIVKSWSKRKARLLISGSYFLNSHSIDSGIDLLCIVPEKAIRINAFFGNEKTKCQKNVCSSTANKTSLYSLLFENNEVTNLRKIINGTIFLITFNLNGINFDLSFAAIPDNSELPLVINHQILDNFIQILWPFTDETHQKMIRALSSHRSLFFIVSELLEDKNNGNWGKIFDNSFSVSRNKQQTYFQQMFIAIKLWAKENYIYSNKYGYLNGAILTIMVSKIVLLYPNASFPFLIEKFFLFYSTRPINLPLILAPLSHSNAEKSQIFLGTSSEQEMPIYTPTFPEQNVGRLITHSGAKLIQKEMIKALRTIKLEAKMPDFNLNILLHKSVPFVDKYKYFVLINCVAEQQTQIFDKFCQFVDGRIRRQIVYDLDPKNGPNIGTHLYPDIYQHNCEMANEFLALAFKPNCCKVWLIGISSKVNSAQMNPLLAQFDAAISKDFLNFNSINGNKQTQSEKMPETLEIVGKFENFKLQLKSILVNKWELLDYQFLCG